MIVILVLAGLALLVLLSLAPFFLPWPHRVRWLIAASTVPDPWGLAPAPWPGLDEVTLQTVIPCPGGLLVVGLSPPPVASPLSLWLEGATDQDAERLEGWTAVRTPLLLMHAADNEVTLYGPTSSVSGLRTDGSSVATGAGLFKELGR